MLLNDLAHKKVLFIAPKFFGYESRVKSELERYGAVVFFMSDKPNEHNFVKAFLRLFPKFMWRISDIKYTHWLNDIKLNNCDIVFVLRGEGVSPNFLSKLRQIYPNATYILYLWDSVRNVKYTNEKLVFFDKSLSFDPDDCIKYPSLEYRPLFYSKLTDFKGPINNMGLFFIGTLNGDRPKVLAKVVKNLSQEVHFDYSLFVRSKLELYIRKSYDRSFKLIHDNHLIFKPLTTDDINSRMSRCNAVLDIEHYQQAGLTMRTFEVLAAEKKLITTNKNIMQHEFYDESRICIIDRENPVIPLSFFKSKFKSLPENFYKKYSISGWLEELIA